MKRNEGQEGEPDVDMFLDENMWSQDLSHVFLFRNISTSGSCSLVNQVRTLTFKYLSKIQFFQIPRLPHEFINQKVKVRFGQIQTFPG